MLVVRVFGLTDTRDTILLSYACQNETISTTSIEREWKTATLMVTLSWSHNIDSGQTYFYRPVLSTKSGLTRLEMNDHTRTQSTESEPVRQKNGDLLQTVVLMTPNNPRFAIHFNLRLKLDHLPLSHRYRLNFSHLKNYAPGRIHVEKIKVNIRA